MRAQDVQLPLQFFLRRLQVGCQFFQPRGQLVGGLPQLNELGVVAGLGDLLFDAIQLFLVIFQRGGGIRRADGNRVILSGNAGQRRQLQPKQQEQEKNDLTGF
ncbi:hypothetical protein D3C79_992070 [compost metagenome]